MIRPPEPTTSHGQAAGKKSSSARWLAVGPVAIALTITAMVAMYTWVTQWNALDLPPVRISVNAAPVDKFDPMLESSETDDLLMVRLLGQTTNDLLTLQPGHQPLLSEPAHLPTFDDIGHRVVGISRRIDRQIEETAIWTFNESAQVMADQYHHAALARGFQPVEPLQESPGDPTRATFNRVYVRADAPTGRGHRVLVVRVRPVAQQTCRATLWMRFDPNG